MSSFAAFHDTRILFINTLSYESPLTFEDWKEQPDDLKAAFLFVQFYNEITLAWDKADSLDFGDDSEGVSTVLQYLRKQVSTTQYFLKDDPTKKASAEFRRQNPDGFIVVEERKIEEDPSKFSPGYIYRVAYNCLYCICGHDRKCDKERMNNETSAIIMHDGEELNVFDTFVDRKNCVEAVYDNNSLEKEFWSVIEDSGLSAEKVMRYLLTNNTADLKALNSRSKRYKDDPLRDIEVSMDAVEAIIQQLREKFLEMPQSSCCGQYISRMNLNTIFA